jgi:hypothetical protein
MKSLQDYVEDRQTALFEETGTFFAFSKEQFDTQKQEGVTYVDCGIGMLCPKPNYQRLKEGLNTIHRDGMRQDLEENGAEGILKREYFNYETHIAYGTQDLRDVYDMYREEYPEHFTEDLFKKVVKECFDEAVENDMF